jgi:dipeptidase
MIAGKDATVDGSVIVAHSDDDVADERVIYVPAANHAEGSMRNVYYDDCSLGYDMKVYNPQTKEFGKENYNSTELRRYIGTSRGPGYNTKDYPEQNQETPYYESIPLGSIPQAKHTYAYFDSNYGIMNEHQLMIGECTCGAKIHPNPEPGKRIFYSAELSRVALERCTKAREAIKLMGQLIKEYGYYGTGETLLIGDTEEAWVMEMCGYDMNGTDGIWVAQRVPDNGYFVAANEFRIREIQSNSEDMMHSDNLFEVCEKNGWWNPEQGKMDWLKTVSYGEYGHPYYSLRRVWRALSKVKPSANLSAWVENGYTKEYPFHVIPDTKLSVADIAGIYRDHYEGTEFDLTAGLAAGPWENPTRYENNPDKGDAFKLSVYTPRGAWERPISIYRCGMFWINQARKSLPDAIGGISWIGLDRPAANCLMPFYVGIKEMPKTMETMNLVDFNFKSAWWAFNYVANYATLKYSYMMDDIVQEQQKLENWAYKEIEKQTEEFRKNTPENIDREALTHFCKKNTRKVRKAWWKLAKQLIVKYNDGCITTESEIMQKVNYPEWWLREVGYYEGPTSYEKKNAQTLFFEKKELIKN